MAGNTTTITISINNNHELIATQTPPWFHYTSGFILLTAALGSFISNGFVVFVFLVKDRKLLTRTNVYITAICCLHFLMATFGMPMVIMSCFNKVWLFGESGCIVYAFLMSFGGLTSIFLLTMISVDRYIFVVRNNLSKYLSIRTSIMSIPICCLITLGFTISPLFGWNQYTYDGVGTTCAIDLVGENNNGQSFVLVLCVIFFAVPVFVIIFAYGSVYTKTPKKMALVIPSSSSVLLFFIVYIKLMKDSIRKKHHVKKGKGFLKTRDIEQELAVTVVIIIGFFLICYTPYTFVILWKLLRKGAEIDPIVMAIPAMITKVAGIFTPFVYLNRNKTFRTHVLNILKSKNKVHNSNTVRQPSITTVNRESGTTIRAHSCYSGLCNNSKQCNDRKCSPNNRKITVINKTGVNAITDSHFSVHAVDISDIYECQYMTNMIRKSVESITDTVSPDNIMTLSEANKNENSNFENFSSDSSKTMAKVNDSIRSLCEPSYYDQNNR